MTLPQFHTFRDMCKHLTTGGAAYRYGSNYPIYCGKVHTNNEGKVFHSIEMRTFGGSSGELIHYGGAGTTGISFSADEQASTNWVFISKEDWDAREKSMMEWYEKRDRENAERQKKTVVAQIIPPVRKPRRKSWITRSWEWFMADEPLWRRRL